MVDLMVLWVSWSHGPVEVVDLLIWQIPMVKWNCILADVPFQDQLVKNLLMW